MGLQERLESKFGGDAAIHIFEFSNAEALRSFLGRLTFFQVDPAGAVTFPENMLYEETPDPSGVVVLTIAGQLTVDQSYEIGREVHASPPRAYKSMAVGPISKGNLELALEKLNVEIKPWWKFW